MHRVVRRGNYFRADDSRWIRRFQCRICNRSFSAARLLECFRQKKRKLNGQIFKLLCSGMSLRRIALVLGVNRKTVVRKFLYLASYARRMQQAWRETLPPEQILQLMFDEMESFERSKCLPLSLPLVVLPGERKILAIGVCLMPAKGLLARLSRAKYGPRPNHRPQCVDALFTQIQPLVSPSVEFTTDENPHYPAWIKRHFPHATHRKVKGRRGCVVGQGELKKMGNDPLFSLNHTAAMIRANVNRMFRRTWCTTKRPDRLQAHLEIYAHYHNTVLTAS